MLNPIRDKNWRHVPAGRRDDTCDPGLSRRSLRENLLRVELESKSDDKEKKKIYPHPSACISLARLPFRNITAKNYDTTVNETHPKPTEIWSHK